MRTSLNQDSVTPSSDIYAARLRKRADALLSQAGGSEVPTPITVDANGDEHSPKPDTRIAKEEVAVEAIRGDGKIMTWFEQDGVFWGVLIQKIKDEFMKKELGDLEKDAPGLVAPALTRLFGDQDREWYSFKDAQGKRRVKKGPRPDNL